MSPEECACHISPPCGFCTNLTEEEYSVFAEHGANGVRAFRQNQTPREPESYPVTTSPFQTQVGGDHYRQFKIQPAEFITKNEIGFLAGCVIKRLCRYKSKGGRRDLEKAIHEIELLIAMEYPDPLLTPSGTY